MSNAVLYDSTMCVGCRSCQSACGQKNGLPAEETFTKIRTIEMKNGNKVYVKVQCMQCEHPACAEACPVGAMEKTPDGPVIYDKNKCFGCRYCMVACPFGMPDFEWGEAMPWVRKCNFCADRQAEGLAPACVSACPMGALLFGEREEILAEAKRRIAAAPDRYINHVYGETEMGGTSWLYLSTVPFETLGLPASRPEPVTLNVERAMGAVPPVLFGVAAAMSGIYWLVKRRERFSREAVNENSPGTKGK